MRKLLSLLGLWIITGTCNAQQPCLHGALRLMGQGSTNLQGRVEVCVGGVWGTVCDDGWNYLDARVVCTQLSHSPLGAVDIKRAGFGPGTDPIHLSAVACDGTESTLLSCRTMTSHTCQHAQDAGVICKPSTFMSACDENTTRLVPPTPPTSGPVLMGRVEVCVNGNWGTVCGDNWDVNDAQVLCTELGLDNTGALANRGTFGAGTRDQAIFLDAISCTGTERSILACPSFDTHDCDHTNDAGAICTYTPCNNFCMNGGTCSEDAMRMPSCTCLTGFTGTNCDIDMNFCNATTCENAGTCVEGIGIMTGCTCQTGFTGATCEIDVDFCVPTTCQNGGTCTDGVGTMTTCSCQTGFAGTACDIDVDFCTNVTCQNGGTCIEGIGTMTTCTCQAGFTGSECDMDMDFCSPTVCLNAGTCNEGVGNLTTCTCQAGFTGSVCEIDGDFCSSMSCLNGGTCMEGVGTEISCSCGQGFNGTSCENDLDFCTSSTCQNGATCIEGVGDVTSCSCQAGFTGSACEIDDDFCSSTSCLNGGTCMEGIGTQVSCSCGQGFSGTSCEDDLEFCTPTNCQNGATCVEGIGDVTSCSCQAGFTGDMCESDLDFCTNQTCSNGGTCSEGIGTDTFCACPEGFSGVTCDEDLNFCTASTCLNGGTCQEGTGLQTFCSCQDGFDGLSCEEDLSFCHLVVCQNGGTCREGVGRLTTCECKVGFAGMLCERDLDYCFPIFCQNGGMCIEGTGTATSCDCPAGYSGIRCEQNLDLCTPTRCNNGGTCVDGAGTLTSCSCAPGFSGGSCEVDLDHCTLTTCMNGGRCEEGRGILTVCFCEPGFTGKACQTDLDYCTSSTCSNGGTCAEGRGRNTSCVCPGAYTGPTCLSPVASSPVMCPAQTHPDWRLVYPTTSPGEVVMHPCTMVPSPSGTTLTGTIRRMCMGDGVWGDVDLFGCRQEEFVQISVEAHNTFSGSTPNMFAVDAVLEDLQDATSVESPDAVSLIPRSLEISNDILNMSLSFLMNDLVTNPDNPIPLSVRIVEIINNVLEVNNEPGWNSFAESEVGSEFLLNNAEGYGQYFTHALMNPNVSITEDILQNMTIQRRNIVVQAEFADSRFVRTILFPPDIDPTLLSEFGSAQSILPSTFLINRGAMEVTIGAVNILMENIDSYLPRKNLRNSTRVATSVISTQLIQPLTTSAPSSSGKTTPTTTLPQETAVESPAFRFTTITLGKGLAGSNPTCVFWNFRDGWSTEGVDTEYAVQPDEDIESFDVACRSTHLTSFAVLLDVNNLELTDTEELALSIVTRIGCALSIVFLTVAVVFFVFGIGLEMFTEVHYFIHLNLSITLLLGYVVFLAGVDTAVGSRVGCAFVAALLHFLFTAAFCWMLCEGIMLFLKLVFVFSRLSKQWWFFLLVGWAPPLVIVAISVGIIHDLYGTENYCWISVEDPSSGAIWAFALPMLIIIIINAFFLGATLYKLYQLKKSKLTQAKRYEAKEVEQELAKQLLIAGIVLLPLLGFTWLFGLLSVSQGTSFFAWLFTILSSLQGVFIFVFHVLRSDKVWGKFCKRRSEMSRTMSTLNRKNLHQQSRTSMIRASVISKRPSRLSETFPMLAEVNPESPTLPEEEEEEEYHESEINLELFSMEKKGDPARKEKEGPAKGDSAKIEKGDLARRENKGPVRREKREDPAQREKGEEDAVRKEDSARREVGEPEKKDPAPAKREKKDQKRDPAKMVDPARRKVEDPAKRETGDQNKEQVKLGDPPARRKKGGRVTKMTPTNEN